MSFEGKASADNRYYVRYKTDIPCLVYLGSDVNSGQIIDMSEDGMCLNIEDVERIGIGSDINIGYDVKVDSDMLINITTHSLVKWICGNKVGVSILNVRDVAV